MAFQPVVDTVEIDIIYDMNLEIVQNSFYASIAGGYVQADLDLLSAAIGVTVVANWLPAQNADAIYLRTEVRGLALENDIVSINSVGAGPGLLGGVPLPNNVTLAVKKSSGFTGRSARGRTYWIGMPQNKLEVANENQVIAAYVVDIINAVDAIRLSIIAATSWVPVLVSRFAGGAQRTSGVTFPWIDTTNVNSVVDTLRGRLPD